MSARADRRLRPGLFLGLLAGLPPLLGAGSEPEPAKPPVERRAAEEDRPAFACSTRRHVCVHAPEGGPLLASALGAAERTLTTLEALGLPSPRPDGLLGPSPALDVYLFAAPALPEAPAVEVLLDPPGRGGPRPSAWVRVALPASSGVPAPKPRESVELAYAPRPERLPAASPTGAPGCALEAAVSEGTAGAALAAVDADAHPGVAAMVARHLASLAVSCAPAELALLDAFQTTPERSLASQGSAAFLFPAFLDASLGASAPGVLPVALLAISSDRPSPPPKLEPADEPDLFDALRETLGDRSRTLDGLLLDFAVARAFVGSRSDGLHLPDVAKYGDAGRVRFEWNVSYDSLPRRLAPLRPIEPTGATYLWLDLASAPDARPLELTFVAEWEAPPLFRWSIVKVDRQGAETGRIDVAGIVGDLRAERTIVLGEGDKNLAGLLIVGTNAGSLDRSRPYDPDDEPVGHGYTVTLYKELGRGFVTQDPVAP